MMLNNLCRCFYFWQETSNDDSDFDRMQTSLQRPEVCLDVTRSGQDVVIVKNGRRVCGTGGALSNVPIVQNKAYFEVKIQTMGNWGVGLASRRVDLNKVPLGNDNDSWILRSDACIYHNAIRLFEIDHKFEDGDILGITYDHEVLNFYLNGNDLDAPVTGIRGTVFPVFYVDEGAILDVQFNTFYHQPPIGYDGILLEKSIF